MKTAPIIISIIALLFLLCAFIPLPLLTYIPLALCIPFLLIALIWGLVIKNKAIWISQLILLCTCPIALYMTEQRSADYLYQCCHSFIENSKWQVSDTIIEQSNLGYIYNSSRHDQMIKQLAHLSELAEQVDSTAAALGANKEQRRQQVAEAIRKASIEKNID